MKTCVTERGGCYAKRERIGFAGEALDWAVAKAEGLVIPVRDPMGFGSGSESGYWIWEESGRGLKRYGLQACKYSPSTKWSRRADH